MHHASLSPPVRLSAVADLEKNRVGRIDEKLVSKLFPELFDTQGVADPRLCPLSQAPAETARQWTRGQCVVSHGAPVYSPN